MVTMKPLAKHFRAHPSGWQPVSAGEARRLLWQDRRRTGWQLLMAMAESRYLTAVQAAVRLYPGDCGLHTATVRLHRLWSMGLLEAFRPEREITLPQGGGSTSQVYMLSALGAEVVSGQCDIDPNWRPLADEEALGAAHLTHHLMIGDVHAALIHHARSVGGQLQQWAYEPTYKVGEKKLLVRPDATVLYRQGDRSWALAIEVDRGTETVARVARDKTPRYNALWESDDWRLHFPDDQSDAAGGRPRVLMVVADGGPDRLVALKVEIERILENHRATYRLYRFVLAQDLYRFEVSQDYRQVQVAAGFDRSICRLLGKPIDDGRGVFW